MKQGLAAFTELLKGPTSGEPIAVPADTQGPNVSYHQQSSAGRVGRGPVP